jgi:hypothetical protein
MDISLYDEQNKNAIIIENKINGANDQDDQLGRYYDYVESKGYTVKALVYLPVVHKEPNLFGRDKIKELLVILPVKNQDNHEHSLASFIAKCHKNKDLHSHPDEQFFYKQYNELLTKIGGEIMSHSLELEALMEIYKDKEKRKAFEAIASLWSNKVNLERSFIPKCLGLEQFVGGAECYRHIDENKLSIAYRYVSYNGNWPSWFGFFRYDDVNDKAGLIDYPAENRQVLLSILNDKRLTDIFKQSGVTNDNWYIAKAIDFDKVDNYDVIKENYNILEELYNEAKKTGKIN